MATRFRWSRTIRRWWLKLVRAWVEWRKRRQRAGTLGARGEREAERFLRQKGYKIVGRNERDRLGELDLVAVDGRRPRGRLGRSQNACDERLQAAVGSRHVRQAKTTDSRGETLSLQARFGSVRLPLRYRFDRVAAGQAARNRASGERLWRGPFRAPSRFVTASDAAVSRLECFSNSWL